MREADKAACLSPTRSTTGVRLRCKKIITGDGLFADRSTRCLALMVAAGRDPEPSLPTAAQDLDLKRDLLNNEGRALLAIALHRMNVMPKEKAQLLSEIAKPVAERAFDPVSLSSTTRAEAIIAMAFAEAAPKSPQFKQRQDELLKLMDNATNLSTQENLWLLLAFKAMTGAVPHTLLQTALINPEPPLVAKDHTGMAWSGYDMGKLDSFKISGLPSGTPLHALLTAEYRTAKPETDRSDRGIRIERLVKDLTDPNRTGEADAPFKLGDQILVTYRIENRNQQYYVALEDLLPAGLETINPDLPLIAKTYQLPAVAGRPLNFSSRTPTCAMTKHVSTSI